jgi:hypothetical protein
VAVASETARIGGGVALGTPVRRGAQLFAASGFAVAQPLFDLLGRNAEFFAVRGSSPFEIVLFALAVALGIPTALLAVELAVGAVSARAGAVCHLAFLGVLGALFAVLALERAGVERSRFLVAGAVLAGAGLAAAVARFSIVRTFVTILAPAPLVFLGVFLFTSPASQLVLPADTELSVAAVRSSTPVVVLVLDELPAVSLLDADGEIDEGRFPNFARLARSSTWFRNATTLSSSTTKAVPALLSGKNPQPGKLPIFQDHPQNLFTLLGGSYRMNVVETQTWLCPPELCGGGGILAGSRLRSLFSDARVVYLHLVAPPAFEDRLPAIDEGWADFADGPEDDRDGLPRPDLGTFYVGREEDTARFIRSLRPDAIGEPSLNFLHVLLPHGPWLRFPDGRETATDQATAPGRTGEVWWDEGLAEQAYQRHLLQVGYTDGLLGELIARLEAVDLWSRALVVVTADHGVSFREGDKRRAPTPTNLAELGFVPFFVKLPGQATGRVEDKHVTTVDVLPTIADALGIEIPWETAGSSGLRAGRGSGVVRVGAVSAPSTAALGQRQAALARQVELFGTGGFGHRFYGLGPYGGIVGEPLTRLSAAAQAEGGARVDEAVSELLASLPKRSTLVPTPITGTLSGEAAKGDTVAVAVNGVVAAVCQAYQESPSAPVRFSALAAPSAFTPGENPVQVFLVGGASDFPALRELPVTLVGL